MADRLQAGWRSRQNSARLQTDGGEKPGEGRSSEIGCDEDGRPQNPVNLSALRHSGRGNAERCRREARAASCNRPESQGKEADQRVRTFKAHSKQRVLMEFSRKRSECNWLNSKEGKCGQGQNRTADTRIFSPGAVWILLRHHSLLGIFQVASYPFYSGIV